MPDKPLPRPILPPMLTDVVERVRAWINSHPRDEGGKSRVAKRASLCANALGRVEDPDWAPRTATLRAVEALIPEGFHKVRPTHKHVQRGTGYRLLGEVGLQFTKRPKDGDVFLLYIGEDGRAWARPAAEFHDGRFTPVPTEAAPAQVEPAAAQPAAF